MNCMGTPGPDPQVSDAELIEAAQKISDPCFTAKEVRQRVELKSNGHTRERLAKLVNDDVLETKSSGSGRVYWLTNLSRAGSH